MKTPNPAVDAHVPLVRSFILSKKKGRTTWVEPVVEPVTDGTATHRIRYVVHREQDGDTPPAKDEGTANRRGGRCIISGQPMPFDYIRAEGKAGRMGAHLMAIVTEGKGGRNYYSPTDEQITIAESAVPEWTPVGHLPEKTLSFRVQVYGMDEHYKLFTPRQLVALTTFSDLVAAARTQAHADALAAGLSDDDVPLRDGGRGARAYAEAVSVYLAFGVSRMTDIDNALCRWEVSKTQVRNLFGRQAIPMIWDYAENNVFNSAAGDFITSLESIARVLDHSLGSQYIGFASQQDAVKLSFHAITLSTDPPYYDNIGYADLSDFFYVWMRHTLRDTYPDIFGTLLVPKEPELIASPYRHGGKDAANAHFERGMVQTFTHIRRFITHNYPLTVYYAFKQQEEDDANDTPSPPAALPPQAAEGRASSGWETFLTGIISSGFAINGTWTMRSELGNRMIASGTNALASSIVLVCRPRPDDAPTTSRRAFVDALRRELPAALKAMQSGNIAPVDLAQASIGPGMAIYSRYSRVLEANGGAMTVRAALGLINQELDAYLAEQDGEIDSDTRFAVAWFEQYAFADGDFGVADTLARAKNTSVAGVSESGLVTAARGKVKLIHWHEFAPTGMLGVNFVIGKSKIAWEPQDDKRATVWEAVHHLIERLNTHGETGSALLMTKLPSDTAASARDLAYRLYNICERKGWAEHARDYNALVISWAGIGEEAARLKQQRDAGDATSQTRLFE